MPKSKIKIGYIVETQNNKLFMALPSADKRIGTILVCEDGFNPLDYYSDNLTVDLEKIFPGFTDCQLDAGDFEEFNIKRVYGLCSNPSRALKLSTESRPLVWESGNIQKAVTKTPAAALPSSNDIFVQQNMKPIKKESRPDRYAINQFDRI